MRVVAGLVGTHLERFQSKDCVCLLRVADGMVLDTGVVFPDVTR
jgi:hypothetical protein